jgi:hypothetical protein
VLFFQAVEKLAVSIGRAVRDAIRRPLLALTLNVVRQRQQVKKRRQIAAVGTALAGDITTSRCVLFADLHRPATCTCCKQMEICDGNNRKRLPR